MATLDQSQFQELKDRIYALQQLVLAHVVATDASDRTIGDDTLAIVREQADALRADRPFAAVLLNALMDEVLQSREPADNDID